MSMASLVAGGKLKSRGLKSEAELKELIALVRGKDVAAAKALIDVINTSGRSKGTLTPQQVCHGLTDPGEGCLEFLLLSGTGGKIELHSEIKKSQISLGDIIGKGKAGKVYEGTFGDRVVAIKMFNNPEKLDDKEFRKELSIMSLVRQSRLLLPCFGGSTKKGNKFIVTELMETSVYDMIHDSDVKINDQLRFIMAKQIADSMLYLHSRNIIHRDLKSLNLLINGHFEIKICDFGLSRVIDKNQPMTSNIGTVAWIAPEIFSSKKLYSEKADVYSYAVILWELLTRKMPFGEAEAFTIPVLVTKGKRPAIPKKSNKDYVKLIEKCWNQKADKRMSFGQVSERVNDMYSQLLSKNSQYQKSVAYELSKEVTGISITELSGEEAKSRGWDSSAIFNV
eukprot:TRINITY_DN7400_c0_g1_i1.p1 TRINITY_DN7400_c0_g1~~TRINITY_DN7400_c0_g1_i1.p1  ORF type:complete len:412 (-),score=80.25 TRINITY_DN7400_c0_g1_i1:155-1339(-)